ncbi:Solute carrier family 35 member B1 [Tritrichomonas foetus]|uniref:Solute carrier family 35 member B1 n=1 Tax=Tritrichomonas foetus TaxID=1144522 RepID=A0A1J4K6U9_9EUKA|nr:Solute carrier family 35 member B1 [Tritrichomonas foetus]|eukprot:OHT06698.1 Solute carrier family 35 member B1 [Tritrichomonas foetus]
MIKLILAIASMYICFLIHFTIQESLLPQGEFNDNFFHFPSALLFWVNLFNMIAASIVTKFKKLHLPSSPYPYLWISIPQQIGLAASNYAVKYVDYPTLSLLKSAKPMSVMICSIFIFRTPITKERVLVVIVLSIGLAIFGFKRKFTGSTFSGLFLAFVSLLSDAIYVPMVDRLKANEGGPFITMKYSYSWSLLFISIVSFYEIFHSFIWLSLHPLFIPKILAFGFTGCLAHVSLFTAVGMCDGIVISIATTTRKFFSILLSSILFHHHLTSLQWVGVFIVFFALGMEIFFKNRENSNMMKLI